MELTTATDQYTIAEYFAIEDQLAEKLEFSNGKLVSMSGASFNHNVIATNLLVALKTVLTDRKKKYYVLGGGMKVYIDTYQRVYPGRISYSVKVLLFTKLAGILLPTP